MGFTRYISVLLLLSVLTNNNDDNKNYHDHDHDHDNNTLFPLLPRSLSRPINMQSNENLRYNCRNLLLFHLDHEHSEQKLYCNNSSHIQKIII